MDIKEITQKVIAVADGYAKEHDVVRDDDWYVLKIQEEVGEAIQNYLSFTGRGRSRGKTQEEIKEGFANELADIIGMILLTAHHHKIDIEEALERKWYKYL